MVHLRTALCLVPFLMSALSSALFSQTGRAGSRIRVVVRDGSGTALPNSRVTLSGADAHASEITDKDGAVQFSPGSPGAYTLSVARDGYDPLDKDVVVVGATDIEVDFALNPTSVSHQSVTVDEKLDPEDGAAPIAATATTAKELPIRPSTLRDALPMIPGVVRTVEGKLVISDAAEHRSTLLVNSLDATDPATGKFGATVPIDSVSSFRVYKSPFLAEYGRFTAGVVAVDTRRGGDQWNWELNDPTPEFRIRSGHIEGVRGFTPRLGFTGPLIANRLYFSESLEYALRKHPITTQPYPLNETKSESWNSLTQFDYIVSPSHMLTATIHVVPQHTNFIGLDFYTPREATPGSRGHEYMGSLSDHLSLFGGILESSGSFAEVLTKIGAQGASDLTLTPTTYYGNYFMRQNRRSRRAQWLESFTSKPIAAKGHHHLKFGTAFSRTSTGGEYYALPFNIRDLQGQLLSRTEFTNRGPFRLSDWEIGAFAQDNWVLTPRFSINAGMRADSQSATSLVRFAPRVSTAWSPFGDTTILRAGYGWFFDRVPLGVYGFDHYPERTVIAPAGSVHYINVIETVAGEHGGLVFGERAPGNFAPESQIWNAQIERQFWKVVHLRASYLQSRSSGLPVLRIGTVNGNDALLLSAGGRANSKQFELVSRFSWEEDRQFMLSYVHGKTQGHLNDFSNYLSDFPAPVIRPDEFATSPLNIPHRFLAWGTIRVSRKLTPRSPQLWPPDPANLQVREGWRFSPMIEYRTGFPFSSVNAAQQYAGVPNTLRFPDFFSLDLRVTKDMYIMKGRAVQISFSLFNATGHQNPDSVRLNTADPQFGQFLGQHPRRYRLDFDF